MYDCDKTRIDTEHCCMFYYRSEVEGIYTQSDRTGI